jgi:hypothetical protein
MQNRAQQRGESRRTHARAEAVAGELLKGNLCVERGTARLLETRGEVERGWWAVSDILVAEGRPELAAQVRRFRRRCHRLGQIENRLQRRLLVIDEAHRLVATATEQNPASSQLQLQRLAERVPSLLLLSATPSLCQMSRDINSLSLYNKR